MSLPKGPMPAKLVIGIILKDKKLVKDISQRFINEFGEIDIVSSWIDFDYTSYYEKEFGKPLYRRVFAFKKLIKQEDLSKIKNFTNTIETSLKENLQRTVNIDPGYLLSARFVLATGKNYAHRIYIGDNIYADLTLIYANSKFQKLAWTYPDYADTPMLTYLTKVRNKYNLDLKENKI